MITVAVALNEIVVVTELVIEATLVKVVPIVSVNDTVTAVIVGRTETVSIVSEMKTDSVGMVAVAVEEAANESNSLTIIVSAVIIGLMVVTGEVSKT